LAPSVLISTFAILPWPLRRALGTYPYTFFSRYGEKPGTNPEELLGAAHAACFTMSFVRLLGMANFVPEQVDSKSEVVIDKDGDGFSITSVHLTVTAKIPGIDQAAFQSIAAKAKASCPVSKLMDRWKPHSIGGSGLVRRD
jgi:osmotically inducible protein OsmC